MIITLIPNLNNVTQHVRISPFLFFIFYITYSSCPWVAVDPQAKNKRVRRAQWWKVNIGGRISIW